MFSELYIQVEDAVMMRAATLDLSLRNKVERPLSIRQIAWIPQSIPAMLASGNTRLCHRFLHHFAQTVESHDAGIAQQLSDRALRRSKEITIGISVIGT